MKIPRSGFLTGTVDRLDENDFRQNNPRYSSENLTSNRDRFASLMALAEKLAITPAQLALTWLLHQGNDIFPIPVTRKPDRIDENIGSLEVKLDADTLDYINEIAKPGVAQGGTLVAMEEKCKRARVQS
ncbi:aldo/keto reductase [candidate division CSSED10-310 bacterium]|uniref:Aldo/keto reductase n=1 Tax=candidate division CSSED10-310 bacterium TaxID=2855610 RepID=A0ABV6YRR7_UNCC1